MPFITRPAESSSFQQSLHWMEIEAGRFSIEGLPSVLNETVRREARPTPDFSTAKILVLRLINLLRRTGFESTKSGVVSSGATVATFMRPLRR